MVTMLAGNLAARTSRYYRRVSEPAASVDMASPHCARRRGVVSGGGRGGVDYPAAASKAAFAVTHTFQAPLSLRKYIFG
jgi:hypothetical protein